MQKKWMEYRFARDTYSKVTELFDLPMCMNIIQVFGYDCLFTDSFQEKKQKGTRR